MFNNVIGGRVKVTVEVFGIVFITFEDAGAKSVVSVDVNLGCSLANHSAKAVAHVAGAGFGEGETKDVFGISVGVLENVGDFGRKQLRFAGARTSQNQEWPLNIFNGRLLFLIQTHIIIIALIARLTGVGER